MEMLDNRAHALVKRLKDSLGDGASNRPLQRFLDARPKLQDEA
jgi:hypothetical protein